MYSRRKGKSGSKKPEHSIAPWVKYKKEEMEEIIVKLAKQGYQSAQIGTVLRDQYGIPTVRLKKLRIKGVLVEKGLYPPFPEDMFNLMKRAVILHNHLEKNRWDTSAKRGLELTKSKIRRLAKHYIGSKEIPADWKYDIERVKLLVK